MINERIDNLFNEVVSLKMKEAQGTHLIPSTVEKFKSRLVKMIVEETLKQVDEQCYGRWENQWYYEDDKRWVRLHFGYGDLHEREI
jgi:hypothetical protein